MQNVIKIEEEKAIIDLMLGVIAMTAGTRSLESYKVDMLDRGQNPKRITGVGSSLGNLSKALVPVSIVKGMIKVTDAKTSSSKKGTRL